MASNNKSAQEALHLATRLLMLSHDNFNKISQMAAQMGLDDAPPPAPAKRPLVAGVQPAETKRKRQKQSSLEENSAPAATKRTRQKQSSSSSLEENSAPAATKRTRQKQSS